MIDCLSEHLKTHTHRIDWGWNNDTDDKSIRHKYTEEKRRERERKSVILLRWDLLLSMYRERKKYSILSPYKKIFQHGKTFDVIGELLKGLGNGDFILYRFTSLSVN